jgi:hypothetical protein
MALPENFLEHFAHQFDNTRRDIEKREAANVVSLDSVLQNRIRISNAVQPAAASAKRLRMVK